MRETRPIEHTLAFTMTVDALAKVGKMPLEQAEATVTDWQIKGKYNVEVW